jgi:GNAT superfamily N-acetyltransferase
VRAGPELLDIGKARFLTELDTLVEVYAAAMRPPREQVPGRRAIMERHTQFPSFRAVVVTAPAAPGVPPGSGDGPGAPRGSGDGPGAPRGSGDGPGARRGSGDGPGQLPGRGRLPIIAFSYGFHGADGQWWHDLVRSALTRMGGYDLAQAWLGDSFEVAEVHVHPDYQGRGIGRRMVPALLHPRLERTALLSTQDADSRARRLYRGLGFGDLLTGYRFPGTDPPYAVMGAALPLRPGPPPPPRRG